MDVRWPAGRCFEYTHQLLPVSHNEEQQMKPVIYTVEPIGGGSLSIMAKPVAGEWIEDEFANIAALGITCVVSLLEPSEALELGLQNEQALVEKNGMLFKHFPIPDRGVPSSEALYSELMQCLYQDAASGHNVVIHCRAGIGRAGMVAAGVLLHCGFAPLDAFAHISKVRGIEVPDTQEQIDWVSRHFTLML